MEEGVAPTEFAAAADGVVDCAAELASAVACEEKRDGAGFPPVCAAVGMAVVRERVRLAPRRTRFRFMACVLQRRAEVRSWNPSEAVMACTNLRDVVLSIGDVTEREDADNKCILAGERTRIDMVRKGNGCWQVKCFGSDESRNI